MSIGSVVMTLFSFLMLCVSSPFFSWLAQPRDLSIVFIFSKNQHFGLLIFSFGFLFSSTNTSTYLILHEKWNKCAVKIQGEGGSRATDQSQSQGHAHYSSSQGSKSKVGLGVPGRH